MCLKVTADSPWPGAENTADLAGCEGCGQPAQEYLSPAQHVGRGVRRGRVCVSRYIVLEISSIYIKTFIKTTFPFLFSLSIIRLQRRVKDFQLKTTGLYPPRGSNWTKVH